MREWLMIIRKSKGLTQADIAKQANIRQQAYSMIEKGERNPSVSVAKKIAEVLNFDWTRFYEDETNETEN